MNWLRRESAWDKVARPLRKAGTESAVRTGLTVGATAVALSAASSVASALRRRQDGR
jgi:hypothetical protein